MQASRIEHNWRIVPLAGLAPSGMRHKFVRVDHHDVARPLWLLQHNRLPYNGLSTHRTRAISLRCANFRPDAGRSGLVMPRR